MLTNLHTHTIRCKHAVGADEEYVIKAIEAGYDEIGFSDHAPMLFKTNYYSTFRMKTDFTDDYIASVKSLQNKYKGKIIIHIGFELEYYPKLFDETIEFLINKGAEFFILGQHFTDNESEPFAHYNGRATSNPKILEKYAHQLCEGIATGIYTYAAHPDLIKFTGKDETYNSIMTEMCTELKHLKCPVEANLLGFCDNRNYPDDRFWQIAAKVGNKAVIGLDAHAPGVYTDKTSRGALADKISSLGVEISEGIKINKVNASQ